jgi:phospholipid/cholesterol/gamma-HCH transport system substrate-binding protein
LPRAWAAPRTNTGALSSLSRQWSEPFSTKVSVREAGPAVEPLPEGFTSRHVHAITGTFVLIVVGLLIASVVWTGRSQRWLRSKVPLRIVLPEAGAAGIRQGSEVYFLGTLVGSVSDVTADYSGQMQADVKIRHDFFRFVREDSSAVVKKKFGVAGDSFFEITRGSGAPLPEKNASILCNEQFQSPLDSAIEEVRHEALAALQKASAGLDTWTMLGSNLITSRERLDRVITRLDEVTAEVQQGDGTLGKLLKDSSVADELKELVAKANISMDDLSVTAMNLRSTSGHLQTASTNLPAIGEALGGEASHLPGLVLQTQTSMREMERLIEAMQRHWLLRKYVNRTNPPPLGSSLQSDKFQKEQAEGLRSPKDSTR